MVFNSLKEEAERCSLTKSIVFFVFEVKMKITPDCANFLIYLKLDSIETSWTLGSWVRNCLKKYSPRKTLLLCGLLKANM